MYALVCLAKLEVQRRAYERAATVMQLLGMRKSGPGDAACSLADRADALSQALLQVGGPGL